MSQVSPESVAAPVVEQTPGQVEVPVLGESTKSTPEVTATPEKITEGQPSETAKDEGSESGDTDNDDTSKWIGKRLERERAKEREKSQSEIEFWKKQAMGNAPAATPNTSSPSANKIPLVADYNSLDEYNAAFLAHNFKEFTRKQSEVSTVHQRQVSYNEKAEVFMKTVPTFKQDVVEFLETYKDVSFPELEAIAYESKVGPALVHYLAKNNSDVERILELSPHRRAIELGKLEDKLSVAQIAPAKKTNAPASITPEKGGATVKKDITDPNLSQAEYRVMRMAARVKK